MNLSQSITGTYGTLYYVADMNKAVTYYKDVLNLTPDEGASPEWTTFTLTGGHQICLHGTDQASEADNKGKLILNVKDIEGVAAELKKRGAEVVRDITNVCDGGYSFDIRDANGIELSFFEYKG